MSAYLLLNLSNELRKRDKIQGLACILLLFHKLINKFSNTGEQNVRFCLSCDTKIIFEFVFLA